MENYIRLINKTEDYIEANLDKKITLKELAANVHLSEYHFHRIFKKFSQETLNNFITRIKLERSGIYLKVNRDITITEIAYGYGYCDSSSYCKAFRKHFGKSPSQFRNEQDNTSANLTNRL
jgi:AraC family transcriptional regulator